MTDETSSYVHFSMLRRTEYYTYIYEFMQGEGFHLELQ